ncbi:hypothetical protein H6G96_40180 [Nostoc sp. FACHB-892]|nr:hypothetical protein [Nostoc sp. FACHB-892]
MVTEIKLGLCNPPEPIYLYVKNAELGGESYLWYHYDIQGKRISKAIDNKAFQHHDDEISKQLKWSTYSCYP